MISLTQVYRLLKIFILIMQHALNRQIVGRRQKRLRILTYLNPYSLKSHKNRGEKIRCSLESMGPIYVKFGQLLSTRGDLVSEDIISELEKLQDNVKPFSSDLAIDIVQTTLKKNIHELYAEFDREPLASASIAQVHAARLHSGEAVIVKIVRPNIEKLIKHDIAALRFVANLVEKYWKQGKRLRPMAIVREFEKTLYDELDLVREAANASQLKRNFEGSAMMYVPGIHWSHTAEPVMTMERIYGVRISDVGTLKAHGVNLKKLAEYGVEIFFTQVFRDSFFHADMHPGNLFVDISDPENPSYLGVDFGIMGTLAPVDQMYLAENILAFLNRDYQRIAQLHIDSAWVDINTRVDEFESAIRTVCEPIFEKPLSEISFGELLLKLFQTAERFHMVVQPQLFLLQKTLFYIESLGRKLYPDLDLWETAKPFMTKWMHEQKGAKALVKAATKDWRDNTEKFFQLPSLAFNVLSEMNYQQRLQAQNQIVQPSRKGKIRSFLLGIGVSFLGVGLFALNTTAGPLHTEGLILSIVGAVVLVLSIALSS